MEVKKIKYKSDRKGTKDKIIELFFIKRLKPVEISENKEITIYYKFNILNMRKLNDEEKIINVG